MGEEKKVEEEKKEEKKDEKKEEQVPEIVLKVDMHCEACARKVARALKGFEGVDEVTTDSKTSKVVVKGKAADPIKVCERLQKKSGRKVELISPLPIPAQDKKGETEAPKEEVKKEEPPAVVTIVLKIRMHCEACAQALQKRIRKIQGVESVETDLGNDQVIVKGVIDPAKLVDYVYKRTKKQASIVKDEEKKKEEEKKEEKPEEKKDGEETKEEDANKLDIKLSEFWPSRPHVVEYANGYAPQIFSDENPNACSVM
ncbi:Heavy metal-associated isoprenylated plant protein [Quillaja saponaria]|uniref:Heavy metal-associated isoprenylated plant protein n=1 Tax=Quillaja saponaria TaxID=32244 RepID=A0AAD7M135_QUISA|nr:Heavy metal-associated isoprenylated plant protein [Quillaja saponaria]